MISTANARSLTCDKHLPPCSQVPAREWPWKGIVEEQLEVLLNASLHRVSDGGIHVTFMGAGPDMMDFLAKHPRAQEFLPSFRFSHAGGWASACPSPLWVQRLVYSAPCHLVSRYDGLPGPTPARSGNFAELPLQLCGWVGSYNASPLLGHGFLYTAPGHLLGTISGC
jgi:hypothetical protein